MPTLTIIFPILWQIISKIYKIKPLISKSKKKYIFFFIAITYSILYITIGELALTFAITILWLYDIWIIYRILRLFETQERNDIIFILLIVIIPIWAVPHLPYYIITCFEIPLKFASQLFVIFLCFEESTVKIWGSKIIENMFYRIKENKRKWILTVICCYLYNFICIIALGAAYITPKLTIGFFLIALGMTLILNIIDCYYTERKFISKDNLVYFLFTFFFVILIRCTLYYVISPFINDKLLFNTIDVKNTKYYTKEQDSLFLNKELFIAHSPNELPGMDPAKMASEKENISSLYPYPSYWTSQFNGRVIKISDKELALYTKYDVMSSAFSIPHFIAHGEQERAYIAHATALAQTTAFAIKWDAAAYGISSLDDSPPGLETFQFWKKWYPQGVVAERLSKSMALIDLHKIGTTSEYGQGKIGRVSYSITAKDENGNRYNNGMFLYELHDHKLKNKSEYENLKSVCDDNNRRLISKYGINEHNLSMDKANKIILNHNKVTPRDICFGPAYIASKAAGLHEPFK